MAGEQSVAELILKIVADSTEVRKALQEASDATGKFAKEATTSSAQADSVMGSSMNRLENHAKRTTSSFSSFGQGLRQLSRNMIQFGTMMMGPVVGALAATSKGNYAVGLAMTNLGEASKLFAGSIAKEALPMVKELTDWILKMKKRFDDLPESVKKGLVEFSAKGGALLVAVGTVARLVFYLSKIPPILYQIGIVGATAFAAWKIGRWIGEVTGLDNVLSGPKGLFTRMFEWLDKVGPKVKEVFKDIQNQRTLEETDIGYNKRIAPTMPGGVGNKEGGVDLDSLVVKAGKASEAISNMRKNWLFTTKAFGEGLKQAFQAFGNWGQMIQGLAVSFAGAMASAFETFFFDLFSGQLKSSKEYFASFGEAIVKMIVKIIAQLVAMFIIIKLISMIPGGSKILELMGFAKGSTWNKHEGGMVKHEGGFIRKAHEGLTGGEIPIIAQKGEGILSRNGMATLGSEENLNKLNAGNGSVGGSPIYLIQNIQSWDASDVIRNKKALAAGMIEEIMNNGALRGAIKRYT